jgi:hypothetical protein
LQNLEFRLPVGVNKAFGPGAVYDFLKALRDLLASGKESILIVDPYLDEQVFDAYLAAVAPQVTVRLLCGKSTAGLKPAISKFALQTKIKVEARASEAIHDRVLFHRWALLLGSRSVDQRCCKNKANLPSSSRRSDG